MNIDGDLPEAAAEPGLGLVASMEPSMNIDGDSSARAAVPRSTRGFNGAVDEHRRRHAFSTWDLLVTPASMEPSMNIDGDSPRGVHTLARHAGFNGAVDEHRRRQCEERTGDVVWTQLQWSRR